MKKFYIFLLLISIPCFAKLKDEVFVINNVYVIDGDTVNADLTMDENTTVKVKVRFLGIDAPEMHGDCEKEISMANDAKNRLKYLMSNQDNFYLKKVKDDKYLGRIDAYVYFNKTDTKSINQILIDEGLVRSYKGDKRKSWCENL